MRDESHRTIDGVPMEVWFSGIERRKKEAKRQKIRHIARIAAKDIVLVLCCMFLVWMFRGKW